MASSRELARIEGLRKQVRKALSPKVLRAIRSAYVAVDEALFEDVPDDSKSTSDG